MRINIVSGDAMAEYGEQLGFKNYTIFAESMIDGVIKDTVPFSQSFISERAKVHGIHPDKYRKKCAQSLLKMRAGDEVHVYFGEDLFCQLNLITLLAFLEKQGIDKVTYHVVFEDEMKETALIENVETAGFSEIYKAVLINHESASVPLEIMEKGIMLYQDYLDEGGKLASFIRSNETDSVLQLTVKIIKQLPEYGLGTEQCAYVINKYRPERKMPEEKK
ncbi:MAG: hypothetical protein J6E38_09690 [Clostridia bacterium]|nr:hypothetical protein [Clostridia bacterium]